MNTKQVSSHLVIAGWLFACDGSFFRLIKNQKKGVQNSMKRKHLIFFLICCLMLQPISAIAEGSSKLTKKALPMAAEDRSIQQFDHELVRYQNEWDLLMKLSVKNKDHELAKKLNRDRNELFARMKDKRAAENGPHELLEKYKAELKVAREQLTPPTVKALAVKSVATRSLADHYEPNDDISQASPVSIGNSLTSYLSYADDQDFYMFEEKKNSAITVSLQVPAAMDYDIYVLDELGEVVASSANGTGEEEICTFQATAGSRYYPVVYGFGFTADESYQLRLAEDQLYLFQPYDVSLLEGVEQVFQLTPTTDGIYRIYTRPYGDVGPENDTVIELYSDSGLTNLLANNDDASDLTRFSEVTQFLVGGQPYYVKLGAFGENVHARIQADLDPLSYPELTTNNPLDVTLEGVSRNVYKFTPQVSGNVKFSTGPFGGGVMVVDTVLELYADENLSNQLATNDDNGESLFSEIQMNVTVGEPVYVVLWAYSDDFSFVRLSASLDSPAIPTITVDTSVIQESSINDGTITATQIVTLTNGTFVQNMSTGVSVNNLPPGLGIQVTRVSNTQILIAFTGKATNHANVNDVSNATVTINPAKVVGATASLVSNPFQFDFIDKASNGSSQYIYNNRNQLTHIYENGSLIIEITYDENGNVLTKTRVN
ncbi:hypothetical protein AB432_005245 [Brevibacillus brevis]|uniref:Peptidase C-terminal archaeal/bacterial domain-containing protein n=2 Tax=Brevibacillus brevis TaxID=1393 RepID=A0A2Z4MDI3_BREBE|nr:hypothetical protein AB432_005245 [Brevibacillus brevis]